MSDKQRYAAAAHAMQSGVKFEVENELKYLNAPEEILRFLKHERTGINSAMSDVAALASLMIKKGLITEAEYLKEIADFMEKEKLRYETHLSALMGRKITLG